MQRLPALRRKVNYIAEIDATRKRPRVAYDDLKDIDGEVVYEEEVSDNGNQYTLINAPTTSKLTTRRFRTVCKKNLYHDPEYYRVPTQVKLEVPQVWPTSSRQMALNMLAPSYYGQSSVPTQRMTASIPANAEYVMYNDVGDNFHRPPPPEFYNASEEIEDENGLITRTSSAAGYDYLDLRNGEIQEQVEVVDDEIELDHTLGDEEDEIGPLDSHHNHYHNQFKFPGAGPIDLYKFFEVLVLQNQKYHSNEGLMSFFLADPAMANPLNVSGLIEAARNSSSELNAQAIASLAMQINYLKKDLIKIKQDLTDLRAVCLARENPFISADRKLDPLAEVSQDWVIPAIPPLVKVDLVMLARELGNYQSGKHSLRNEDLIRRFVRSALEKLVPRHFISEFTVRDKGRGRVGHPRDIGEFAKNQIIGIVLDLMGLHNLNELDNRGRAERAHYFQLTNRLMKCAIYDMRRIAPKKRKDVY